MSNKLNPSDQRDLDNYRVVQQRVEGNYQAITEKRRTLKTTINENNYTVTNERNEHYATKKTINMPDFEKIETNFPRKSSDEKIQYLLNKNTNPTNRGTRSSSREKFLKNANRYDSSESSNQQFERNSISGSQQNYQIQQSVKANSPPSIHPNLDHSNVFQHAHRKKNQLAANENAGKEHIQTNRFIPHEPISYDEVPQPNNNQKETQKNFKMTIEPSYNSTLEKITSALSPRSAARLLHMTNPTMQFTDDEIMESDKTFDYDQSHFGAHEQGQTRASKTTNFNPSNPEVVILRAKNETMKPSNKNNAFNSDPDNKYPETITFDNDDGIEDSFQDEEVEHQEEEALSGDHDEGKEIDEQGQNFSESYEVSDTPNENSKESKKIKESDTFGLTEELYESNSTNTDNSKPSKDLKGGNRLYQQYSSKERTTQNQNQKQIPTQRPIVRRKSGSNPSLPSPSDHSPKTREGSESRATNSSTLGNKKNLNFTPQPRRSSHGSNSMEELQRALNVAQMAIDYDKTSSSHKYSQELQKLIDRHFTINEDDLAPILFLESDVSSTCESCDEKKDIIVKLQNSIKIMLKEKQHFLQGIAQFESDYIHSLTAMKEKVLDGTSQIESLKEELKRKDKEKESSINDTRALLVSRFQILDSNYYLEEF